MDPKILILQEFCNFFWELRLILFDTPKDAVFPKTLVLSNIFGFPPVKWVPKWVKIVNFRCIVFEPKFKISKDFSNTVFVFLEDYLWWKSQQDQTIFGGVRPKTPQKGTISWLQNQYEKPWKFLTSQTQMLYHETYHRYISNKVFHLPKCWGVTHRV